MGPYFTAGAISIKAASNISGVGAKRPIFCGVGFSFSLLYILFLMTTKRSDDQFSEEEIIARREAALKRMLATVALDRRR